MKKNKKFKIVIVLLLLLLTTGCTKTLTDSDKKAVKNEDKPYHGKACQIHWYRKS